MCLNRRDFHVNHVFFLSVCLCVVWLFPAVRQQLGHGGVALTEPGAEPGHPVGPGIKEKYSRNTLTGLLFTFWTGSP